MQIPSRFTIAVHTLMCIDHFAGQHKATSEFIASSVNVNPVIIRQVLQKLKAAGLVTVERGAGGAALARPASDITLLDVLQAIEGVKGPLFNFHENPNPACPGGRRRASGAGGPPAKAQSAMEQELASTSLADLLKDVG
ncbi:MAG: Rrf2 family transcriptional regulator [Adlercreutzia equolifaciens]